LKFKVLGFCIAKGNFRLKFRSCSLRAPAERKRPDGVWRLAPAVNIHRKVLTLINAYASKTIPLHKQNLRWFLNRSNIKHKVIAFLMLDAGLRISEACSIKKNFDFKTEILPFSQKGVKHLRTILSNHIKQSVKKKDFNRNNSFFFLQNCCSRSYFRKTWEALNLISNKTISRLCIRMPYGIRLQRTIFLQVHLWQK
jgi:integrase